LSSGRRDQQAARLVECDHGIGSSKEDRRQRHGNLQTVRTIPRGNPEAARLYAFFPAAAKSQ